MLFSYIAIGLLKNDIEIRPIELKKNITIDLNISINQPENESGVQIASYEIVQNFKEISKLAQDNLFNKTYKKHVYDCSNFSQSLVDTLNDKGYTAFCSYGNYVNGSEVYLHTWVSVYSVNNETIFQVEATNGNIIYPEDYEKHYFKIGENVCI